MIKVGYLGRYWLGGSVPLLVMGKNSNNTFTDAAEAPYARIYSSSAFVKSVRLPKIDHAGINGAFQYLLRLDSAFATGFYDVVVDYVVSAVQKVRHIRFEIVAGGSGDGSAIEMYYLRHPDRSFLLSQLDTGKIKKLRNPRFSP